MSWKIIELETTELENPLLPRFRSPFPSSPRWERSNQFLPWGMNLNQLWCFTNVVNSLTLEYVVAPIPTELTWMTSPGPAKAYVSCLEVQKGQDTSQKWNLTDLNFQETKMNMKIVLYIKTGEWQNNAPIFRKWSDTTRRLHGWRVSATFHEPYSSAIYLKLRYPHDPMKTPVSHSTWNLASSQHPTPCAHLPELFAYIQLQGWHFSILFLRLDPNHKTRFAPKSKYLVLACWRDCSAKGPHRTQTQPPNLQVAWPQIPILICSGLL